MRFGWRENKKNRRQHIFVVEGDSMLSLCKIENGSHVNMPDTFDEKPHPQRRICQMCRQQRAKRTRKQKRASRDTKRIVASSREKRLKNKRDPFLFSREWKEIRYRALKLSGGKCECCGRSPDDGVVLNVDHVKPRHKFPELALDLSNLQVLCSMCNQGKGGWDETDWREPRLATLMGEAVDL